MRGKKIKIKYYFTRVIIHEIRNKKKAKNEKLFNIVFYKAKVSFASRQIKGFNFDTRDI